MQEHRISVKGLEMIFFFSYKGVIQLTLLRCHGGDYCWKFRNNYCANDFYHMDTVCISDVEAGMRGIRGYAGCHWRAIDQHRVGTS